MSSYTPHTFIIPTNLQGISQKNIEEHLKLYTGYVQNTNAILEKMKEAQSQASPDTYVLGELSRRFSFEFNGMKNHEFYFHGLEGGPKEPNMDSNLYKAITKTWGSFDTWMQSFTQLAKTRGAGWAIMYYDKDANQLLHTWVDEQHLGHLNSCHYILGIDMWEHAFVADYQPSGKAEYIKDYLANLNWSYPESLFEKAS
jgi:Fe-Mn family superoxide dismutase